MPAAVRTAFAVADWFVARARQTGEALQPLRLQQMLFLAQARWAATTGGRALMPAAFVADELGPLEPNVHAALAPGRPTLDLPDPLPEQVALHLERVWRTCGSASTEALLRLTTRSQAYVAARERGPRASIPLAAIAAFGAELIRDAPPEPPVTRRLRAQDGRAVRVAAWTPPTKPADKPPEGGG